MCLPAGAQAGKKDVAPPLSEEHVHPSQAFSFKTPAGWKAGPVAGKPELYEATDGTLVVRFLHRDRESGYDSLHADCMLERLAGAMETSPQVAYEYDFLGGAIGSRRLLDSAFVIKYDAPVLGHREWRQRNLTVVGEGSSLCIITHAPAGTWKKSKATRDLLEGIVRSVTYR
jgi:hypothetical protein